MTEYILRVCERRNTTCYDCDDEKCSNAGDKMADCPKYHCDNPNGTDDCDHCAFIDGFIKEMRKAYGQTR